MINLKLAFSIPQGTLPRQPIFVGFIHRTDGRCRTQAAGGAARRANAGLCPGSSQFQAASGDAATVAYCTYRRRTLGDLCMCWAHRRALQNRLNRSRQARVGPRNHVLHGDAHRGRRTHTCASVTEQYNLVCGDALRLGR